jgi:hypothetical protein
MTATHRPHQQPKAAPPARPNRRVGAQNKAGAGGPGDAPTADPSGGRVPPAPASHRTPKPPQRAAFPKVGRVLRTGRR